jgi:hypothetical protein
MFFEQREIKPYAEPISARDLQEGTIYFFLNFVDDDMLLPTLEPVVFIGRNLEKDDEGQAYFQDVDSFQRGIRYDSIDESDSTAFYSGSENELGHVFEYERALDALLACSLRRQKSALKRGPRS